MKPVWRRVEHEIVILTDGYEYRFHWQDADVATALYLSLLAEWQTLKGWG